MAIRAGTLLLVCIVAIVVGALAPSAHGAEGAGGSGAQDGGVLLSPFAGRASSWAGPGIGREGWAGRRAGNGFVQARSSGFEPGEGGGSEPAPAAPAALGEEESLEQSLESDEDPFANSDGEEGSRGERNILGFDLIGNSGLPDAGEEDFQQGVGFFHKYKLLGGRSDTRGLFSFQTGADQVKELRFITTYEQTIRIPTSAQSYDFVRFSINFVRSFDTISDRFFDDQVFFNELYFNYRKGAHQLRAGSQVFSLGNVDFDRPIDKLNHTNLQVLLTLNPEEAKEPIPSLRYNWFGSDKTLTLYFVPFEQKTFGRKFTDFREEVAARDQGEDPQDDSILRDYSGLQFEWTGASVDLRLGVFHWFDPDNDLTFDFNTDFTNVSADPDTFNTLTNSFRERESSVNFATLEFDGTFGEYVWKVDGGWFDSKNFLSFERLDADTIRVKTIEAPHWAVATSLERAFPIFFLMGIYSYRRIEKVPGGSHILLYENEAVPSAERRNLEKEQFTVVMFWRFPSGMRLTIAASRSSPFEQDTIVGMWSWDRAQFNSQWFVRVLRFETEVQKITGNQFGVNQVFLGYSRSVSGL